MADLSIIIPSRNEMFLARTIQDILEQSESDTEIIAVLDGQWAEPPIPDNDRVTLIYHPVSIGQRAACNEAAKLASGKYLMKLDAHCSVAQGFDRIMLEDMNDSWTMVPVMRNLHAFDWVCPNGHRRYQGPSGPCIECKEPTTMDVVWISKQSPQSRSYCFDSTPHFQYFGEYLKRNKSNGSITQSMSLQGSCFMMTKEKYFDLEVCDERFGSWGSQGIEVAVKTWLSGGEVMVNNRTYYAHMFRTQGGDFSFPYPISGRQVQRAKKIAKDVFFNNKWPKQKYPLSWLVKKFWPVPGWTDEDLKNLESTNMIQEPEDAGIVYYTDNRIDQTIMTAAQTNLIRASKGIPIVSVSLKPINFGENIVLDIERGYLTMFKQILAGLKALNTRYAFLCEHDILYHSSHFDFVPPKEDEYYYNLNVWKVNAETGIALHYDCKQTSGLCANRELLVKHYEERVRRVEKEGFSRKMGFEPGSHHRPERVDDVPSDVWQSEFPNIDIRHSLNLTPSRWRKDQFRDQRNCKNWIESDSVPGWGKTEGRFKDVLLEILS